MFRARLVFGMVASVILLQTPAIADDFPSRPITIVVPYAPGGATDQSVRLTSEVASKLLGQPIVVENRPGGGGQIAASTVKNAAPDGYTLLLGDVSTLSINPSAYSKLSYDPVADFEPITELVKIPHVLLVSVSSPYKSIDDLIKAARSRPGAVSYASTGTGTGAHLLGEMLGSSGKLQLVHVPYKGGAVIVPDLMASRVDFYFGAMPSAAPLVKEDKLRALVVTDAKPAPLLPNVPVAKQAGVPNLELTLWLGFVAPAKTPEPVIAKLHQAFSKALSSPELVARLTAIGANAASSASPGEFKNFIKAETDRLRPVVHAAGIKIN